MPEIITTVDLKMQVTLSHSSDCKRFNFLKSWAIVLGSSKVIGPKGFIDIKENFTCVSEGVIYVIECKECGSLYVGETCRKLGDRFREHRRKVLNNKVDNEIAAHFFSGDHSVKDMAVCGLYYCRETVRRKCWNRSLLPDWVVCWVKA